MKIKNTEHETTHPWPEGIFIQGGGSGLVFSGKDSYTTAFVEVCPEGTFLRGEGATIGEAEDAAWAKYQTWINCDGTGEPHGPWEARHYENGAGYCTRCGVWAPSVLEPSQKNRAESGACDTMVRMYGDRIVSSPWWRPGVKYFTALHLATWNGTEYPELIDLPTVEAFNAWCGDDGDDTKFTDEDIAAVITAMSNVAKSIETPVENDTNTP